MTDRVEVRVEVKVDAPADDTEYRIVMFRRCWRVYNAANRIMAVCETRQEAAAYIARQGEPA